MQQNIARQLCSETTAPITVVLVHIRIQRPKRHTMNQDNQTIGEKTVFFTVCRYILVLLCCYYVIMSRCSHCNRNEIDVNFMLLFLCRFVAGMDQGPY